MLIFGHKVFAPEELAALGSAFDEAWGAVEGTSGADARAAADARTRLASIMIGLAQLGELGPEEIRRTAIRIFPGAPKGVAAELPTPRELLPGCPGRVGHRR